MRSPKGFRLVGSIDIDRFLDVDFLAAVAANEENPAQK